MVGPVGLGNGDAVGAIAHPIFFINRSKNYPPQNV